jgi:FkbM family methyltransferase
MLSKALEQSVNLIPWSMRRRIKDVPVVASLQRWFFANFLSGREFLHQINAGPAKGLTYPISLPLDKLIWTGAYEVNLATAIASAVKDGDICYDIGAYRGFFSGVLALAGAAEVIAFEPFPTNFEQLERLVSNNPDLPLKIQNIAIGRNNGIAEFTVMADSSMGKLATSSFQSEIAGESVLTIPVRTLDTLVEEDGYTAPNVLKIDVEGAEVDVLEGARRILEGNRPRLFIEAHSHELGERCFEILDEFGYEVSFLNPGTSLDKLAPTDVSHLIARP